MRIIAFVIAIYAPVMLLIHVSTGRILKAWNERPASRVSRRFPPKRALRIEALFWVLAMLSWSLWHFLALKVLVVLFGAIHLAIWAAGEVRANEKGESNFASSPTVQRIIVIFDSVEALVLAALGVVTALYLIGPG